MLAPAAKRWIHDSLGARRLAGSPTMHDYIPTDPVRAMSKRTA